MPAPKQNEIVSFIANIAGEDTAVAVWKEFQGCQIYIPRCPKNTDPKQEYIVANFDGSNHRKIAKELDISVRQLQKRLNRPRKPAQYSLFG